MVFGLDNFFSKDLHVSSMIYIIHCVERQIQIAVNSILKFKGYINCYIYM